MEENKELRHCQKPDAMIHNAWILRFFLRHQKGSTHYTNNPQFSSSPSKSGSASKLLNDSRRAAAQITPFQQAAPCVGKMIAERR